MATSASERALLAWQEESHQLALQALVDCESAIDVEMPAPLQKTMEDEPEHAAWAPMKGDTPAKPCSGDSLFTKIICCTCGIGEPFGSWVCGCNYTCCCIKGLDYCGLGGSDNCPAADGSCDMFKPKGECSAAAKILFCKVGIECPEKPWLICNGKNMQ